MDPQHLLTCIMAPPCPQPHPHPQAMMRLVHHHQGMKRASPTQGRGVSRRGQVHPAQCCLISLQWADLDSVRCAALPHCKCGTPATLSLHKYRLLTVVVAFETKQALSASFSCVQCSLEVGLAHGPNPNVVDCQFGKMEPGTMREHNMTMQRPFSQSERSCTGSAA